MCDSTGWWASYKGQVKGHVRHVLQAGELALVIRIDGGPITRVEAREIPNLLAEVRADLAHAFGITVTDPKISVRPHPHFASFEAALPSYLEELEEASDDESGAPTLASSPKTKPRPVYKIDLVNPHNSASALRSPSSLPVTVVDLD